MTRKRMMSAELAHDRSQYLKTPLNIKNIVINNKILAKEEHVKKSYESVVEQKLFSFIESKLIVNKETVTLEDFLKKNN